MESTSDAFDCRVSQFYEALPLKDACDDGADEFFDVLSTPPTREQPAQDEEFFTPLANAKADSGPSTRKMLSPLVEVAEPAEESSVEDDHSELVRVMKKARRGGRSLKPGPSKENHKSENTAQLLFEGIHLEALPPEKRHSMTTRQDVAVKTPKLSLRTRSVVRADMKRVRDPSPNDGNQPPPKYLALAEQIQHFFKDTPPRFKPSRASLPTKQIEKFEKLKLTIPQSPKLLTKQRHRSPTPPQEEPMPQVKANPVKPQVFLPPNSSLRPPAKPTTVARPFNLTQISKKENKQPKEPEVIKFKARPVPRSCRSSLASFSSMSSLNSVNDTRIPAYRGAPILDRRGDGKVEVEMVMTHSGTSSRMTRIKKPEVKPFSFDVRDRIARQKKEEKIKKVIEESLQVPKFTARPVPSYLKRQSIRPTN